MYESHFGFSGSPFQLNPDPSFYFGSRGHSNALAYLKFGAHQGEGFIVVTGEIGAGKTTLVRTLLEGLDPEKVVAAQVVSTQLESSELLQAILMAFGVGAKGTSKAHLIATLEGFLTTLAAKGRRALLIIDEAQNLKHEAVEELRMLSNFQLGKYGLLQSFLVGQPELRGLLQSKSMEQLRQRVIASCHLGPLDATETEGYIEHRLRRVGWNGVYPEFQSGVMVRIHQWTGGVPRRINRLCNRLLLGSFLANTAVVSAAMVDETALALKAEIGEAEAGMSAPAPLAGTAAQPAAAAMTAQPPEADVKAIRVAPTTAPREGVQAPGGVRAAPKTPEPVSARPANHPGTAVKPGQPAQNATRSRKGASRKRREVQGHGPDQGAAPSRPQRVAGKAHDTALPTQPILCLVESASAYLIAGVLADVFRGFPSLPRVVAVHPGVESCVGLDDLDDWRMPLPAMAVHLGIAADSFASQTSKLSDSFDALLSEFEPRAVMVLGSSDADLACSLLAKKRGFPLLRASSGKRTSRSASNSQINATLIEKIADVLYTDSTESFYALYREGIHLDRVCSVGSLTREMLDIALANASSAAARRAMPSEIDPGALSDPCGLITVDPRVALKGPQSLAKAVQLLCELSRELPLIWILSPEGRSYLAYSSCVEQLEAARIRLVGDAGAGQALEILRAAKCLIATDEGPWLQDARALALPSLVLNSDASLDSDGSSGDPALLENASISDREKFAQWLAAPGLSTLTPDYWDGGTAARIAAHLVGWMSRPSNAAPRHAAQAAAVLVHQLP